MYEEIITSEKFDFSKTSFLTRVGFVWSCLGKAQKNQLLILPFLCLLTSALEVFSIGLAIPFIAAVTNPDIFLKKINTYDITGVSLFINDSNLLIISTVLFVILVLLAGFFRLVFNWLSNSITFDVGNYLGYEIYRRTIYQTYENHLLLNSSRAIDDVINKSQSLIYGFLSPIVNAIAAILTIVSIAGALLFLDAKVTLIAFICLATVYFGIGTLAKKKLKEYGQLVTKESLGQLKTIQEGLGSIRDVILGGKHEIYCQSFLRSGIALRDAKVRAGFIAASPRLFVESVGLSVIAVLLFFAAINNNNNSSLVPFFGAFVLGMQKLMPMMQMLYASWASIENHKVSIGQAIEILATPIKAEYFLRQGSFNFCDQISFNNVSFNHLGSEKLIFDGVTLQINKGDVVGIIGPSGVGKSTFLDILMGLLIPTDGALVVDGVNIDANNVGVWQKEIAHVPQSIYLLDASIVENIAFGISRDKIDYSRVDKAVAISALTEFINELPIGYETVVGDRGVRLSGGQKQRIGIARALYSGASILIFDEATSALDKVTESEIIKLLDSLRQNVTIVLVAHGPEVLSICNRIFQIDKNGIHERAVNQPSIYSTKAVGYFS